MLPTIAASLLLLGATPDQDKQAAALYHQSATEYELGNFDAALVDIAKAYRLDPRPALLFNLGQCHRALHHWERAAFFYREYVHKVPDAPNREAVGLLIADMQQKLFDEAAQAKAVPKQTVLVEAPPPRATVAPAPPAAVEAAPPPERSHALGIGVLSAGLALGLLTGISALEIVHYNGAYAGSANQNPGQLAYSSAVSQALSQAGVWQIVEITSGILAIAGCGFAPFVW